MARGVARARVWEEDGGSLFWELKERVQGFMDEARPGPAPFPGRE
jgi:hypothetical protein